jgi:hypothetical protein
MVQEIVDALATAAARLEEVACPHAVILECVKIFV